GRGLTQILLIPSANAPINTWVSARALSARGWGMSVWVSSNRRRTFRHVGVAVTAFTLLGLSACSKDEAATANSQLASTQSSLDAANTQNSQLQGDLDDSNATNSSLAAENDANKAQVDQLTTQ